MTTTYNVIRHNESDTQDAESIFGASQVDESQAPSYGGTATVEDLKKTYQGSTTLQQTFGSFENYLGYMTEASEMLGQQNWWNAEGVDARGTGEKRREEEDLSRGPAQDTARDDLRQSNYNARQSQYQQWLMSEQNQALMAKYGISPTITNEKGDVFNWTGSGYVRTYKQDRSQGRQIAKAIMIGIASYGVGQVVSGALAGTAGGGASGAAGGASGAAGGAAGVAAPTATSGSSIAGSIAQATGLTTGTVSSAAGAMVGNAAGQLLLTGEINLADMFTAGITAGILEVADALQYMDPALAESVPLGFVDDQINNLADLLHTDYNTALDIAKAVSVGAIEGGDLQGIVNGAVATLGADYITDTIQETIGTTVPNFFEEGTTTINPNAVEEVARIVLRDGLNGELDAGTLMSAGLGYIRNDGTFAFMDPSPLFPEVEFGDFDVDFGLPDVDLVGGEGFDITYEAALDEEGEGNLILQYDQNTVDQIENILKEAKEAGSEFNQAVIQPIVDVIQEAGYAVDDYVLQPIKEAAESLWNALPDLPEGPQTNLPSLTGPDVNIPVDIDTPSFSLSDINFNRPFGEQAARFSPLTAGAMAQQVQLLSPVQVNPYDPTRFGSPIVSNLFSEYIK